MIRAGEYTYRLTLQKTVNGTDAEGYPTKDWQDVVNIWAAKQGLNGREFFAAAAVNAENMTRWKIRYRTDVNPAMRLFEASTGRTFDITSAYDEAGNKQELVVMTKEVISGG